MYLKRQNTVFPTVFSISTSASTILFGRKKFVGKVGRVAMVLLFIVCLLLATSANAQNVTINLKKVPVQKIFKEISRQTKISLIYTESMFKDFAPVTINVTDVPVNEVLDQCFQNQPFSYSVDGNTIIITKATGANTPQSSPPRLEISVIKGVVINEKGIPLEGASVVLSVNGRSGGTYANAKGIFFFVGVARGKYNLKVTSIGYDKYESSINASKDTVSVKVILKEAVANMGEVVVNNGIYTRPKANFTGAASSFTGDQLREISPTSIFTALRTLDASVQIPVDNVNGSNPNMIPRIQVRGSNSLLQTDLTSEYGYISNPPLIIIDGFEAPLQRMFDIDINIIARITILKDAAATAIYGSKSANGVIVIETKQPKMGETQVNYTTNLQVDIPDLSSFNLMNAQQKFAFEQMAGRYKSNVFTTQQKLNDLYNLVAHNVQSGVNTYWLSQPLQTQFNQTHSLSLGAGSEHFVYQGQFLYNHNGGVMKGSKRDNLSGNLHIRYNLYYSPLTIAHSP